MPTIAPAHKAIERYYADLKAYAAQGVTHEGAIRSAFQTMLATTAKEAGWMLIPELPLDNGRVPDGTVRDANQYTRGYWEAKDTGDNLTVEIAKKIAIGYPTINTIFEDSRQAVLYQDSVAVDRFDLTKPQQVAGLLSAFLSHATPAVLSFEQAESDFRERIPELADRLKALIATERTGGRNGVFRTAYANFRALCAQSLDPHLSDAALDEMLVQHVMTERLFRQVFGNPDFTRRNVIAAEIEKVVDALTSYALNRNEFLRPLDRFYESIEGAAGGLADWTQKQAFLNHVYERFFQGYSVKQADTHGIVTTPQQIVDFMCASVEHVLRTEFGTSLAAPGVRVIDPCTGTGTFMVNLIRRIAEMAPERLAEKYANDLFANEVLLLPYYIAALNIEHAYYERMKTYQPFDGLCFADTLDLAERAAHQGVGERSLWMTERNTERVQREQDAPIMVVIGNPPYNVGQGNENDNNKNRPYTVIDRRIRDTYVRDSKATSNSKIYDAYVRFFRWATDRLGERDGVVCLVSNNSFIDQFAFDGMRKHLLRDFTQIYHLDLHGNVRKNPKLSGTSHNVFGIQIGVGITIAVRASANPTRTICYCRVPGDWRREQKLAFLGESNSIAGIDWQALQPDDRHTWLTDGMRPEFDAFLAIGTKEAKLARTTQAGSVESHAVFKIYTLGVSTNRDQWVYDFLRSALVTKVQKCIEAYNSEVDRWKRRSPDAIAVDNFVTYDDKRIKWSRDLKADLQRGNYVIFSDLKMRTAMYRPFCKQVLFFDRILNEEVYRVGQIFPTPAVEAENCVIWLKTGSEWPMFALMTNVIPNSLPQGGAQCFPFYTYAEDGTSRRENITDWALGQFQAAYGAAATKRDIFHYVYAMLHHPVYREHYAENLKRELPRIPLLPDRAAGEACVRIGRELAALHVGYEQAQEWPLERVYRKDLPPHYRVEKMRLTPDKSALVYNEWLTLTGIPPQCFEYRLGNRSALEWVIDQYQVSTDTRSQITTDPNNPADEHYILRLIGRVIRVSMETVRLVNELAHAVSLESVMAVDPAVATVGD